MGVTTPELYVTSRVGDCMSTFARSEVIKLMRRVGMHDAIPAAMASLPDPVDTDRDSGALEKLGLSRGHLMEILGSGP